MYLGLVFSFQLPTLSFAWAMVLFHLLARKVCGFPASTCISVNEVVCHGVPGGRTLRRGDIVNVDVTVIIDGYQ